MGSSKEYEKSTGNIFKDLEFDSPEQELLKAKLAYYVHHAIAEKGLTQAEAASLIGITQPDVSKLKNGHYARFTAERLFKFLNRLDYNVDIHISRAAPHEGHVTLETV